MEITAAYRMRNMVESELKYLKHNQEYYFRHFSELEKRFWLGRIYQLERLQEAFQMVRDTLGA